MNAFAKDKDQKPNDGIEITETLINNREMPPRDYPGKCVKTIYMRKVQQGDHKLTDASIGGSVGKFCSSMGLGIKASGAYGATIVYALEKAWEYPPHYVTINLYYLDNGDGTAWYTTETMFYDEDKNYLGISSSTQKAKADNKLK